jgi:hypothetical protein
MRRGNGRLHPEVLGAFAPSLEGWRLKRRGLLPSRLAPLAPQDEESRPRENAISFPSPRVRGEGGASRTAPVARRCLKFWIGKQMRKYRRQLMRFVTAKALAPTATRNSADSKSHQMNERPRNHSSRVVMSIMPRATLNKMRPISRPSVTETAGDGVMRECRTDQESAEGHRRLQGARRRVRQW